MNPQEIQKQNLEANKAKETINENNKSKDKLQKIIEKSNLKPETIENLRKILALVDINELNDFIISEPDLDDIINNGKDIDLTLSLEWIIDNFLMKFWESKSDNKTQKEIKSNYERNTKTSSSWNITNNSDITKTNNENIKNNIKEWQEIINKNISTYKKIFADNKDFLKLLDDSIINYEIALKNPLDTKHQETIKAITEFLKTTENRKAIFDKLATSWSKELYEETYQALSNLSPTISWYLSDIPSTIYKVEKLDSGKIEDRPIISQFPWANPKDIERRWNLVSYWDKTIDLRTGKAFISGEWGYAIETSMSIPNSLDVRAKYLAERLEIIDEIKTNEKILHLLENKETLKQKLETLKNNKSTQEKSAQDLQIDIEINAIETEIKKINEKLKIAIPWYSEEQDNNLKTFLKEKITQSQEKLTALKTKFDEDMQKLLEAWQDEILARDKKVRETMSFLDDLWITNINQNDLQKIIDRINIHPHAYGFSKKIDLKAWFEWSPTDALKQKKEFFHLFSKIYEKMNFIPPVNESIIEWFNKDERLKNDTIFKQKLEDIWVTKGWAIQIETVMNILWEKPEERERVYNGKPTQKEKVSETVETK